MNKREIIIVVIAVVIATYGLLDYLIFSNSSPSDQAAQIKIEKTKAADYAITAEARIQMIQKITQDSAMSYWILQAESPWENDPFIKNDSTAGIKTEKKSSLDIPQLNYTGFVQAGKNMMAIINGMEYMTGELIKEIGYKVFSITPTRVKLLTDTNREITLSIEEN